MFTNSRRQEERIGKYGTPRVEYLQDLVTQFQNASSEETKEKIVANLANFAYDPFNFTFLRQLNVLELFLDCITEPNERIVEFGIGGICNACAYPTNAALVTQSDGIPLVIQCLSSPVRNTLRTFRGHKNERNFVGLTVNNEYIVCGSETNEVFVYHKAISKPIAWHGFESDQNDPDEEDMESYFISSVCWMSESPIILAANSQGNVQVLELVAWLVIVDELLEVVKEVSCYFINYTSDQIITAFCASNQI